MALNKTSDKQPNPSSIKDCFDRRLLQSLCRIGKIEGAKSADEAANEQVKKWYEAAIADKPRDQTERIRSAINSVKFKLEKMIQPDLHLPTSLL